MMGPDGMLTVDPRESCNPHRALSNKQRKLYYQLNNPVCWQNKHEKLQSTAIKLIDILKFRLSTLLHGLPFPCLKIPTAKDRLLIKS